MTPSSPTSSQREEENHELGANGALDDEDILSLFATLLVEDRSRVFREQLWRILADANENGHFSVTVDSRLLLEDSMVLGHLILREPSKMLALFSRALIAEQERLRTLAEEEDDARPGHESRASRPPRTHRRDEVVDGERVNYSAGSLILKTNVHARINWLPYANCKRNISSIRAHDVGSFLQFSGTVVRTGMLKVLEAVRVFRCTNSKCGVPIRVFAAVNEVGSIVQKPTGPCPHCRKSASYHETPSEKVCHDYQEIRVQDEVQKLGVGSVPRAVTVVLLHDLVDRCKPGSDVVVTGVPVHRWGPAYKDERCSLETVVMANTVYTVGSTASRSGTSSSTASSSSSSSSPSSVTLESEKGLREEFARIWAEAYEAEAGGDLIGRALDVRDAIVGSVCPQLHGMYLVKLALLLSLIGSPPIYDPASKTKVRGESHLLLVGDPGTGKSQFLRFACKLFNRSVLTTGVGTTGAGLTCSVVREGSEFMLESGALVLADRGLCCIDEFGSIREHDRATIHEAMEQQTISVAKAGLVTLLNTRCIVLAATNPKGSYDLDADVSSNTGIAPPLLSRFDLVIVILDRANLTWDRTVSEFILKSHLVEEASSPTREEDDHHVGALDGRKRARVENGIARPPIKRFSLDKLRAYLAYVKSTFEPELSNEAALVLQTYYSLSRTANFTTSSSSSVMRYEYGAGGGGGSIGGAGRTTLRFLESLIRLSKSHARLMARDVVLVADAVVAVSLVDISTRFCAGGGGGHADGEEPFSAMHADFPRRPEEEFLTTGKALLTRLKLERLIPFLTFASRPGDPPPSQVERGYNQQDEHDDLYAYF